MYTVDTAWITLYLHWTRILNFENTEILSTHDLTPFVKISIPSFAIITNYYFKRINWWKKNDLKTTWNHRHSLRTHCKVSNNANIIWNHINYNWCRKSRSGIRESSPKTRPHRCSVKLQFIGRNARKICDLLVYVWFCLLWKVISTVISPSYSVPGHGGHAKATETILKFLRWLLKIWIRAATLKAAF